MARFRINAMRMHERHSDKPSLHDVRQHAGGQRPAGEFVFSADVFTRLREASTWWSQPVCPQHLQVRGQTTQIPDGDTMSKANGGARRDRTDDLLLAKQALSQLSYGPFEEWPMVGPGRVELPTSRLSGVRSNHLSYGPSKATEINVAVNHGNLIAPASCPIKSVFTSAKKEKRRRRCPAKMLRDFGAFI